MSQRDECWYCGSPATCLDHVIPKSRGGSDDSTNLVPSCDSCNKSKRNSSVEQFRERTANKLGYGFTEDQKSVLRDKGVDIDKIVTDGIAEIVFWGEL